MPIFPFFMHGGIFFANLFFIDHLIMPQGYDALLFLLTSLCLFFAVIFLTMAYTMTPMAAIVAPFQYTQILWGVIFGYLIFAEIPDQKTVMGVSIIIAAGLFMIWREYHRNKGHIYRNGRL
jgi:drug/metabolite transporter (DMT)-like permease